MKRPAIAGLLTLAAACASPAPEPVAPVAQAALVPPPAPTPTPTATPTAAAQAPAPSAKTDYSVPANWLCRPGIANNACDQNLDATIVKADGSVSVEKYSHNPNAPIDCFYVYPTVSLDPFTTSDLVPGPEELNVVRSQFARFGKQCRLFAPMYRQFSLGALRARMSGGAEVPTRGSPLDANADVDAAWDWYMANENKGRGVVVIGHSQGSSQIIRLLAAKVDGKPDQAKLVSTIIMGMSVQAPRADGTGGSFKAIPVCKTAGQTGCVISYSTFRETVSPSATAMFGLDRAPTEAVCTNPAALGGGKATNPKAYWSTGTGKTWSTTNAVSTGFVMTPGLVTTECVKKNGHTYLEARLTAETNPRRLADPFTDVMAAGKPDPSWGLHLVDANIGMGDLVDIVGAQAAAWKKAHP